MIKVRQVKVDIEDKSLDNLKKALIKKLKIKDSDLYDAFLRKESIDARDKKHICYSYEVDCNIKDEDKWLKKNKHNKDVEKTIYKKYDFNITGDKVLKHRPVIVGAGPCGLFAAYMLCLKGFRPIVIDRGEKIEDRVNTINNFWKGSKVDINSNVSFGEGGAGTFSDGKLNTLTKDTEGRIEKAFEIFVDNGAPVDIMYVSKPHIGTDVLRKVIVAMRKKMELMGAKFMYNSLVTDIIIKDNKVKGVVINDKDTIDTDVLVLAIGHSARDTFKMLNKKGLDMESKPFAVGLRVLHSQDMINESQYGKYASILPNASYKLTYNTKDGRGVYSFCMCPGGYVVNASSEDKRLCINGMSDHDRDSGTANSAIVVTVSSKDYGDGLFDGVEYQRKLEEAAYTYGKGNIPVQLYKDFVDNKVSDHYGSVEPKFKGHTRFANINEIIPKEISDSIKEAMKDFDKKIKGFANDDTIMAAIEARTSSPIRIIRDDNMESNIEGIYPCGEGAGYAGGITTSAVDGIKVSEKIMQIYKEVIDE